MATATPDPQRDIAQDRVNVVVGILQADLARAESKVSLLLALSGSGLVALVSVGTNLDLNVPVAVFGSLGVAALLSATVVLLLVARPDLRGSGWPSWPQLNNEELRERLMAGYKIDHLRFMAELAARKFRLIRVAVDCMLAGVGLLAFAVILAVATD